ncbi:MAG: rhodanese-like domain-containing protein [Elusimicrobia bacterium]|nr:rhodanese-like domain-containing protein [Elusimicrobiota bacterium]
MKNKTTISRGLVSATFLLSLAAAIPAGLAAATALGQLGLNAPPAVPPVTLSEAGPAFPTAIAAPADIFNKPADKIYYLSPWQVDLSQFQPAPAAGSAVDNEDLAAVRRWQAERTEAQCAAANAQANATYDEFFGEVSPFGNPAPAEVEKIFDKVRTDAGSIVYVQKEKYKRPRPFLRDSAIMPCLGRESGYSYPSGHATTARVFGLILSDLVPADSGMFMSYAYQGALNRVIGGVHHPSDIAAGKDLGDAIYKALKQNGKFKTDMDTLRRNLKPAAPRELSRAENLPLHVPPAQALNYLEQEKPVLLDIRTPDEYAQGHLKDSTVIDFYAPDFAEKLGKLDKSAKYLIYCRTGRRSGKALETMQQLGFTQAHDIEGGITAWTAAGYPVVK